MSFAWQVAHVFRKDLGRFWPALLGMVALIVANRAFGLPLPERHGVLLPGPVALFPLLFVLFAAAVVHDDPTESDRGLWQTTPLSRGAVLAAKLLFVGLFLCLLPALVQVQWIVALAEGGVWGPLLRDATLYQGGLLALAMLGAAVTPNLGTFLVVGVAVWVGTAALGSVVMVQPNAMTSGPGLYATRDFLTHAAWLAIGLPLVAHQYLTRIRWRTVAIGVAALTLTTVGIARGTFDLVQPPWEPETRFAYEGPAPTLRLLNLQSQSRRPMPGDALTTTMRASLVSEDEGILLSTTRSRATLSGPEGSRTFTFGPGSYGRVMPVTNRVTPVDGLRSAGAAEWPRRAGSPLFTYIAEAASEELRTLRTAGRLSLELELDAFVAEPALTLPLEVGATVRQDGSALTVAAFFREEGSLRVELHAMGAVPALAARGEGSFLTGHMALLLVNRARGEFLIGSGGGGGASVWYEPRGPEHYIVSGPRFEERPIALRFDASFSERDGYTLPPDWFDDVELLLVDREYVGSLTVTLERDIPRWPLDGDRPVEIEPYPGMEGRR